MLSSWPSVTASTKKKAFKQSPTRRRPYGTLVPDESTSGSKCWSRQKPPALITSSGLSGMNFERKTRKRTELRCNLETTQHSPDSLQPLPNNFRERLKIQREHRAPLPEPYKALTATGGQSLRQIQTITFQRKPG